MNGKSKHCEKCKKILHKSEFTKDKRTADGLSKECVHCKNTAESQTITLRKKREPNKYVCQFCGADGYQTDQQGDTWCRSCFKQTVKHMNRQNIVHVGSKVGRNEPCPCNSGKKYKQCCIGK